jgi:LysR family hydrogen peroxide-inducible transcriptional activator
MVGAGIGVTLIPDMAVEVETRSANVAVGRFAAPKPTRTIGMIWRTSSALTDQLEGVAGLVRDAAAGLVSPQRPVSTTLPEGHLP